MSRQAAAGSGNPERAPVHSVLARGLLLLLPLWLSLGVDAAQAQTATRPEVRSLQFEGNDTFGDRALANSILTRASACRSFILTPFCWGDRGFAVDRAFLNPRVFREDYVRIHLFYRQRGFREVQVDTVVNRRDAEVDITFRIAEGDPHRVTSLDIVGLEALDSPSLTEDLPLQVGDPLNMIVLEAVRDTLERRLQNEGYAHVDVLRNLFIPADSREAEVEFDVFTGPRARFGPIEVVGNQNVSDQVVRRMLPFQEGSFYSQELLFEAQRNVYNLEIFRHAAIDQDLDHQPDSIVPLQVQVNEGNTHRVRTGGGWNTAECFSSESRWSSRNFRGGARRLVVRGRVSNILTPELDESICSAAGTDVYGELNWVVSADFTQPFIFSPRNSFSASIFAERQSLQDIFVRQALGLNLGLTRTLGRGTPLTFSYRPQLARLDAAEVFFCTSFLVCDPVEIDILQASNRLSPIGVSLSRNRTDRAISPTGGYSALIDVEHASAATLSDYAYERAVADVSVFHEVIEDLVVAGRLRGGWLRPREFTGLRALAQGIPRVAHPQKRFYAGGSNSVRGYAQNQLGPQVVSAQVEDLVFPVGGREEALCSPEAVAALSCDASGLEPERFFQRPTGGGQLVEGNLELRFPIWGSTVGGAAFVDFGRVWDSSESVSRSDVVFTPGFGVRYGTPIGPIRVDLAYRPSESRQLPVVTSRLRPFDPATDAEGARLRGPDGRVLDWVVLEDLALLDPRVPFELGGESVWDRIQIHFSIGQAF